MSKNLNEYIGCQRTAKNPKVEAGRGARRSTERRKGPIRKPSRKDDIHGLRDHHSYES